MSTSRTPAPTVPFAEMRAMRRGLSGADDSKIRRIASLVEGSSGGPAMNQALLDPIRTRLAAMRPPRPLRLPRLLFTPFDPLIAPANTWRASDASVPRSALMPISRIVEAGLGDDAAAILAVIADQDTENIQAISDAGSTLWPRAADIVANAHITAAWRESGLPDAAFKPLQQGLATVWRRAVRLRLLFRDGQIGALQADGAAVSAIMSGTPNESLLGCAMVARLILVQSPFAARHLQLFASASANRDDKVILQKAVTRAIDDALGGMERTEVFAETIGQASLDHIAEHVRTLTTLLRQIEDDPSPRTPGPRLAVIRENLAEACQTRFTAAVQQDLLAPLTAARAPLPGEDEAILEATARDLRMIETAARGLGGADRYDALLAASTQAVHAARHRGAVSRMGEIRLVEILSGAEAAMQLYRR